MRIADFDNLIRVLPYEYQSFDIKKSVWETEVSQNSIIKEIFGENEIISISRFDLFYATWNLQEFVLKVLMWGYPTKGRGKNIENLLLPENFDKLIMNLKMIEGKSDLTIADVQKFQNIKGLGLSTISKILYFKRVTIESNPALILDKRVIDALKCGRYTDFGIDQFKDVRNNNSAYTYMDYLNFMHSMAQQIKVIPDQLELFLFEFGSNLKQPKGEEGFDMDELDEPLSIYRYQVFLDLLGIGYSEERALESMNLTNEQLKELRKRYELPMDEKDKW